MKKLIIIFGLFFGLFFFTPMTYGNVSSDYVPTCSLNKFSQPNMTVDGVKITHISIVANSKKTCKIKLEAEVSFSIGLIANITVSGTVTIEVTASTCKQAWEEIEQILLEILEM